VNARYTTRSVYGSVPRTPRVRRKAKWKTLKYNEDCNGAFWRTKRRSQNKEISFQFFVGSSPDPSSEKMKGKDISLVVGQAVASSEARQTRMRTEKYKATTRSARCSYGLFSKWVRAKTSISSPHIISDLIRPPSVSVSVWVTLYFPNKKHLGRCFLFLKIGVIPRKQPALLPAENRTAELCFLLLS
jgi:hypothetical protein